MIKHVQIGLWTLFSWYVFGKCIISKGVEKHVLTLKWCKKLNGNLSYPEKSLPSNEDLTKATNHCTYQMSPEFLVNVMLCAQPPNSKTSFAKKPWLVQDIQMLWYDWCEIHTPMLQSDWCEIQRYIPLCSNDKIHTLMQGSDWRKQHTPLLTYIELFFVMKKEKLKNHWIDNAHVTLH